VLSIPGSIRIYVCRAPIDFRKAHDGLFAVVRDEFGDDPFDGSMFVFLNRSHDRVKVLQFDRDGFWLHYKRLEEGRFEIALPEAGVRAEITRAELSMLLDGIDLERKKIRGPLRLGERRNVRRDAGGADRVAERAGSAEGAGARAVRGSR
jgi:transposase